MHNLLLDDIEKKIHLLINSCVLFQRRHSKDTSYCFFPSVTSYDSQARLVLQVKQMLPALGQFPLSTLKEKVNIFRAQIPNVRRESLHRMMNEAESTLCHRMGIDEKLTDPWICGWDLKLCFVVIRQALWENWLTRRDVGFLWWGWCAVSQHVLGHNAICSTPALCVAARCYSTLSSPVLLLVHIFNPYLLYCGQGPNLYCNIVGGCE